MRILMILLSACILTGGTMSIVSANTVGNSRPAIVLVAFGTSVEEARQVFDFINTRAHERYPDYEIHWAFTSQFIIDKLKQRGIITRNVSEVVNDLRSRGYKRIAFQSLHVVPGQEYHSIYNVDTRGLQVAFGDALLSSDADIQAAIAALDSNIINDEATVVVAHGNDKYPEFNTQLEKFAATIEAQYPLLVVASVEGTPGTSGLDEVRKRKPSRINFIPLMIVAGDHIMNDVLGDDRESWKNIIQATHTTCSKPLGWNEDILDIYFEHLDQALTRLSEDSD